MDSTLLAPLRKGNLRAFLAVALLVQGIAAWNAIGYWHPDQHHSIIEFATLKLGITPPELMAREFAEEVRQTVQVWAFLVFYQVMDSLGLGDAYVAHTVLRFLTSALTFVLFNAIALHAFRHDPPILRYSVLALTNFSWTFPYIRTLFNSEVYGSLFFFASIYVYQRLGDRAARTVNVEEGECPSVLSFLGAALVGLLLSLAFFFRFQMGFAALGFGAYLLLADPRPYRTLTAMAAGFAIGTAFNVALDSLYYQRLSFTPYSYWTINITDGRAMGLKPVWHYVGILSIALSAPPLSFVLLYFVVKGAVTHWKDPYVLSAATFFAAHALVPHKEPRFLFPLVAILPILAGYGLRARFRTSGKHFSRLSVLVLGSSGLVNLLLLGTLTFVPVAQHIAFAQKLNVYLEDNEQGRPVAVIPFERTPYETPTSRNVATYYQHAESPNVAWKPARTRSDFVFELRRRPPRAYFVVTRDRILRHRLSAEMKGCERLLVSSTFLLRVSELAEEWGSRPLPEIWGLYRCAPTREAL